MRIVYLTISIRTDDLIPDLSPARELPVEEVEHQLGDLRAFVFQHEVPRVEQVQLGLGQFVQVRTRAVGRENLVVSR